jgi:hemolysin III
VDDETISPQALAKKVSEVIKPHLRGWLHLGAFPVAVAAGIVLVALSPTLGAKISTAIFAVSAALLFGVSALYHTRDWSPAAAARLKRLDHANIFLIIAGTYTPVTLLLLPPGQARQLLLIVWIGALLGILFRVFWVSAPRWLYVPIYLALGWVAIAYVQGFLHGGGPAVLTLLIVGGALYTLGGIVYGFKYPNPSPRWFGFHEIFHALTIGAFVVHYVGVSIASYTSVA